MGVPTVRLLIPLIADKILKYHKPNENLLKIEDRKFSSTDQINRYQRKLLLKSVDGQGLREANKCPSAYRWLDDGSNFLSGKIGGVICHRRFQCMTATTKWVKKGEGG